MPAVESDPGWREPIAGLRRRRAQRQLSRDDYWTAMARRHQELRDYQDLLQESLAERVVIERDRIVLDLSDGTRWTWPPGDLRAAPVVVLNDGYYEPVELQMLTALMPQQGTALDVGANLGWYSVHLAREGGEGARVYAFEPIQATFDVLEANVRLNGLVDRVIPRRIALGDSAGWADFYTPAVTGSVAASRRQLLPIEPQLVERCTVQTLDEFAGRESLADIALIKCDVEGGELAFLRGATATLASQRPILMIELLRKWSAAFGYQPSTAVDLLASLDYRCHIARGAELVEVQHIAEDATETNYFFVPAEKIRDVVETLASAAT